MCVCDSCIIQRLTFLLWEQWEMPCVDTCLYVCVCACALMYINVFIYCALVFMSMDNFQDKNVFVFVAGGSLSRENGKEPLFYQ